MRTYEGTIHYVFYKNKQITFLLFTEVTSRHMVTKAMLTSLQEHFALQSIDSIRSSAVSKSKALQALGW